MPSVAGRLRLRGGGRDQTLGGTAAPAVASGSPGLVTDTTARTWPHGDQCHVSQSELLERLAFQQQLLQALDAYVEKYGVTYPKSPSAASS